MEVRLSGFADEIDKGFDKQLQVVQATGFHWIELRNADGVNVADFTAEKTREVRAKLDAAGVGVSAIGSPIGKMPINEDFAPHLDKLRGVIQVAHAMDTRYIRMFSFHPPEGESPDGWRDEVFARTEKMIAVAKAEGAVLLHENEKGIYGDIAARCLDLMKAFAGEHYRAVFDFANFVQCGQDTLEAFAVLEPYIDYVHIKDAVAGDGHVVPPGQGDGHVKDILGRLQAAGYQGFLSVEPHLWHYVEAMLAEQPDPDGRTPGEISWQLATDGLHSVLAELGWSYR